MTRKRVVRHPGAAWVAAVGGAWLVAVACRTMQGEVPPGPAGLSSPVFASSVAVPLPAIRVGVSPSVERVSIFVDSGVVVHGRAAGETAVRVRSLPRATFHPAAPGRVRLVETGDELELATVSPGVATELLLADATPYRGLLEVRPAEEGRLTVVNVVNLEDYVRGVVPNELSPQAFPQIEALKAQAVAARTYALWHVGDYASKGYDVCATASCQVYRGQSSEHSLSDRAVEETRGIVATWRGRPIHAYYTSTCGGHTEEGGAIFDDDASYLRGVACLPELSSRHTGVAETAGAPGLAQGELAGLGDGQLSVLHGEADETRRGAAADRGSRYYRWEERLTPADVARAIARYGTVGQVRDIVPKRLGVSGRVVELAVVGSEGQLDLKGLQVRWGLGLRENLFVINRETGPRGEVERFVITGKGWGHGVGLCQVGAFGMAQAGSTFEEILKHYYTGVSLSHLAPAVPGASGRLLALLVPRVNHALARSARAAFLGAGASPMPAATGRPRYRASRVVSSLDTHL